MEFKWKSDFLGGYEYDNGSLFFRYVDISDEGDEVKNHELLAYVDDYVFFDSVGEYSLEEAESLFRKAVQRMKNSFSVITV